MQAALDARVAEFFSTHEFLVLPTVQVLPFPVEIEWPRAIEGVAMQTYIDWMASCYAISCLGAPAISVPCGFSPDGLPVGLQIVGRRGRDLDVLQLARAFEQATRVARAEAAGRLAELSASGRFRASYAAMNGGFARIRRGSETPPHLSCGCCLRCRCVGPDPARRQLDTDAAVAGMGGLTRAGAAAVVLPIVLIFAWVHGLPAAMRPP